MTKTPTSPNARPKSHAFTILTVLALLGSAAVWPAHISGLLPSNRGALLTFLWLLAAGCLGAPAGALRLLGPRLTITACTGIAAFFTALSALLTYLYASGSLHPSQATMTASVLATMVPAIHAYNIGRWIECREAARQAGVREGREMEARHSEQRDRAARDLLDGKTPAELRAMVGVIEAVLTGIEERDRDHGAADEPYDRPRIVRSDERHTRHG